MFIYPFRLVVPSFLGHVDLPFARALSEETIQELPICVIIGYGWTEAQVGL